LGKSLFIFGSKQKKIFLEINQKRSYR